MKTLFHFVLSIAKFTAQKKKRNRKKKTRMCINNLFFFVLRPYVPRGTKRIGEGDKLSQKSDQ